MIGGGYIGLEVSASATSRGVHCTIIERGTRPWVRFGSPEAGEYVRTRYQAEGVEFCFEDEAIEILGDGKATAARTKSGKEFPADFVVVGLGVRLNIELAVAAGLGTEPTGGIIVNEFLQTEDPDIFAAGDVAAYVDKYTGQRMHVEHYMNAGWTGTTAGSNMAGDQQVFDKVAYFFSDAFDIHMALRGTPGGKLAATYGNVAGGNFVEVYGNESGKLQYGLVVSKDESKLDPYSDKLEALITNSAKVDAINADDFSSIG
jgi:3-phenylpropionate/trans-cinnamate dioxygenase ferredoxin reductase subunit